MDTSLLNACIRCKYSELNPNENNIWCTKRECWCTETPYHHYCEYRADNDSYYLIFELMRSLIPVAAIIIIWEPVNGRLVNIWRGPAWDIPIDFLSKYAKIIMPEKAEAKSINIEIVKK